MRKTYSDIDTATTRSSSHSLLRMSGTRRTQNILRGLLLAATLAASPWMQAAGPMPVNLGEAEHFTILAGAAITTTGAGVIRGDIGAYPIAGSAIGIPPPQVEGLIYARDASGTQAPNVIIDADLLLRAKNDLHTAWVDAAGRTPVPSGDQLNPQGGNLGGLTLAPGLYKITSVAYITGANLTLAGGPNDVWIFLCDQNLEVGNGIQVILSGGALSKNVFWQVGTSATLGTGSVFKGTIIADQAITMLSSSTMEGRALAYSAGVTFNGTGGDLPVSGRAINPSPANSAPYQLISADISWSNGGGATNYAVYFGTNPVPGLAEFKTNQTTMVFDPGALGQNKTYYWRIDSRNANGTTPGTVWSFTTSETTAPLIQIVAPTTNAIFTSTTNLVNLSGTASDDTGITQVIVRNNRDIADYVATGTTNWTFTALPLYMGTNRVTATAFDVAGNSSTATVQVVYNEDGNYDDVLRSGNIVQEIVFPDNLIPGDTVTVRWTVLSYVPIQSRIYGGVPGGWVFYRNGEYKGMTESLWSFRDNNGNKRYANLYSFECAWVVPQKSGDFNVWFNVAQMDGSQFMIPVIPDGVDSRMDPTYPKLIQRTVLAGGSGVASLSDPDTWDRENSFETLAQHKARSAVTITELTMPDNLTQGNLVTCTWTVQSYIEVDAQVLMLNLASSNLWVTTSAIQVGSPQNTTFYFKDRITGAKYYAKEYTFSASFLVPSQSGDQQLYFRSRDRANPLSAWMAQNLAAEVDPRPVMENGMNGRLIERTINP